MTQDNNRSVCYFIALERLQRASKFNKEMLTFLGHVIGREDISPDKVSANASVYGLGAVCTEDIMWSRSLST